jgi:hypothetical protein
MNLPMRPACQDVPQAVNTIRRASEFHRRAGPQDPATQRGLEARRLLEYFLEHEMGVPTALGCLEIPVKHLDGLHDARHGSHGKDVASGGVHDGHFPIVQVDHSSSIRENRRGIGCR